MAKLDVLFKKMVALGASDMHLSSQTVPNFRLHGNIVPVTEYNPIDKKAMIQLLLEIAPEENKKDFLENMDTDFAYSLEGLGRFRANYFNDLKGPGAVFRHIPTKLITAEDLGLSNAIIDMCKLAKGLVIVTGPTGSGKSTTLCAMIDHINKNRSDHIITIEDPIEFIHENKKCLINQREVYKNTKSFKNALRAALREDPDIVLVGEMRDLETIEIAIETAETGHLVFGTLHTTTAYTTVNRIIQKFPGDKQNQIRSMLSTSLKGVVAQTLLKRIDGKGRVAAMEILVNTPAIANHMREGKIAGIMSAMQTGSSQGMTLLNDSLANLVKTEVVTKEEALSKTDHKDDLLSKFEQMNSYSLV